MRIQSIKTSINLIEISFELAMISKVGICTIQSKDTDFDQLEKAYDLKSIVINIINIYCSSIDNFDQDKC